MSKISESLSSQIEQMSSELRHIERRLRSEPEPEAAVLDEFRQTVDSVRLTTWSVCEVMRKQRPQKDPNATVEYLIAERLRRFEQMARNICSDLEQQRITSATNGVKSLLEPVQMLHQRLLEFLGDHHARQSNVNDGVS